MTLSWNSRDCGRLTSARSITRSRARRRNTKRSARKKCYVNAQEEPPALTGDRSHACVCLGTSAIEVFMRLRYCTTVFSNPSPSLWALVAVYSQPNAQARKHAHSAPGRAPAMPHKDLRMAGGLPVRETRGSDVRFVATEHARATSSYFCRCLSVFVAY